MVRPMPRLAEAFPPRKVTYWLAGTSVGSSRAPVSHQHGRPDDGVEGNVVLADEVVMLRLGVLPPVLPGVGGALDLRPFLGGRQVADDGVEPDVDLLALAEALHRDVDPPVDVPGDRPVLEALLDPAQGEVQHVAAPALAGAQPLLESVGEVGQAQVEVVGLPADRGRSGQTWNGHRSGRRGRGCGRSRRTGPRGPRRSRSAGRCPRRSGRGGTGRRPGRRTARRSGGRCGRSRAGG